MNSSTGSFGTINGVLVAQFANFIIRGVYADSPFVKDGRQARRKGFSIFTNPWATKTIARDEWELGWRFEDMDTPRECEPEVKEDHTVPVLSPWIPISDPYDLAVIGKTLEEMGETVSALGRCIVQGPNEAHPVTGKINSVWLEDELADVAASTYVMIDRLKLRRDRMNDRKAAKIDHLTRWHGLIGETLKTNGSGPSEPKKQPVRWFRLAVTKVNEQSDLSHNITVDFSCDPKEVAHYAMKEGDYLGKRTRWKGFDGEIQDLSEVHPKAQSTLTQGKPIARFWWEGPAKMIIAWKDVE